MRFGKSDVFYEDGVPCSPGCMSHVTHPCERCGRYGAGLFGPPELDEKGFVFVDEAQRPFWCRTFDGVAWLCYWHRDGKWVTLRPVADEEVLEFRKLILPSLEAEWYHAEHRRNSK